MQRCSRVARWPVPLDASMRPCRTRGSRPRFRVCGPECAVRLSALIQGRKVPESQLVASGPASVSLHRAPADNDAYRFPVSVKGVVLRDGKVILARNERDEWEL